MSSKNAFLRDIVRMSTKNQRDNVPPGTLYKHQSRNAVNVLEKRFDGTPIRLGLIMYSKCFIMAPSQIR